MWAKVAEELAVPWRAAEAMHWQLGETDVARRAGTVPFSFAVSASVESGQRSASTRANLPSRPLDKVSRRITPPSPRPVYPRESLLLDVSSCQGSGGDVTPISPWNSSTGRSPPPAFPPNPAICRDGPGLAPIRIPDQSRHSGPLPSLGELTAGLGGCMTPLERPRSRMLLAAEQDSKSCPSHGYRYPFDITERRRPGSPDGSQYGRCQRRRIT